MFLIRKDRYKKIKVIDYFNEIWGEDFTSFNAGIYS